MRPKNLQSLKINEIEGFVTNADPVEQAKAFARRFRGFRNTRPGIIAERDFGTQHRFPTYPVTDPRSISNATNASPIVVTVTAHGYSNGNTVYISGVGGNTAANEQWVIANVTANTFELSGSTGNGAYTSGGVVGKVKATMVDGFTLFDPNTGKQHEVIIGLDGSNNTRVWVEDSGWIEITRKVTAAVNEGGGIGATDTTVDIDTVDEGGVTITPVTDEFKDYIVINDSQTSSAVTITNADTFGGDVRITTSAAHGFSSGDRVLIKDVVGNDNKEVNGIFIISFLTGTTFSLDNTDPTLVTYVSGGTAQIVPSAALISANTATTITTLTQLGLSGLAWLNNDTLSFYRTTLRFYSFTQSNGIDPHIRFNPVESQRKVNLYYGSSAIPPVMNNSARIQNSDAKTLFFDVASSALLTLQANWFLEHGGGGLAPYRVTLGSPDAPIKNANKTQVLLTFEDGATIPWLEFQMLVTSTAQLEDVSHIYVYITLEFDGYQESDPIFQGFFAGDAVATNMPIISPQFRINPSLMPKGLSAIKVYRARVDEAVVLAGGHRALANSLYQHYLSVKISSDDEFTAWTLQISNVGGFLVQAVSSNITEQIASGGTAEDIVTAIGHQPDLNRSYLKPRFAARVARTQGSIIAVDQDDRTVRLSGFSGAGTHMDDIFPDVTLDVNNNRQKLNLTSRLDLLGLEILSNQSPFYSERSGKLLALKTSEGDMFDLISGEYLLFRTDIVSGRSILQTPIGTVWAGKSALHIMPLTGGEIQDLNPDWKNLYDGTLMTSDGTTPIMTDAFRNKIITGYDPTYGQILFLTQLNDEDTPASTEYIVFRVRKERDAFKWNKRKFNIGTDNRIRFFSSRNDRTLTIGYDNGILLYPNRTGNLLYEDDVSFAGVTASKGIATLLKINIGQLHEILQTSSIASMIFYQDGESVDGNGRFDFKLFSKGRQIGVTQNLRIDQRVVAVYVSESISNLSDLQIELSLPSASLTNFKRWDISTIEMSLVKDEVLVL